MADRVGVEQVIGAGIVLVDALLDQPHPEDAGIEIEVLLCRSRDGGDVVQPADAFHRSPPRSYVAPIIARERAGASESADAD